MKDSGIYIHIPFCDHKCVYCDFYSITTTQKVREYVDALKMEFHTYHEQFAASHRFSSIFFGGGTPSFLAPEFIEEIIAALYNEFSFTPDAEITLETNPGTVDQQKIAALKQAGINRFSIGIQSFKEADLTFMTRIHDADTAKKTVAAVADAGIRNISVDLIFNLPGQTREAWLDNLRQAIELPISHLSAYSLIVEHGTILYKMVRDKIITISDDDFDADLYEATIKLMTDHGFQQYEVSNFCKPGFECRHNNHYWQYRDYLSFGTSAHSFMNGKRWWNISGLTFYLLSMQEKHHARAGEETLTPEQMHDEYIMLTLRSSGLNRVEYVSLFGKAWLSKREKQIQRFVKENFLIEENALLKMSAKGYAVCDEIIKDLL
jgi:oxygen-independent coproporphyrinogen-3 oxidase